MPSNMSQAQFTTLLDFFGWHGTFVLVTLVIFKLFLAVSFDGSTACPCTGNVVYGTAMLGLPAVCIFLVAFFTYFYQEDAKSPWKVLKDYYRFKQPCSFSSGDRNWEMHSGVFHQCTECQGKWRKIKITISFFVSLVYPILWLALGFLQQTYYACAHVGPNPRGILNYCYNGENPPEDYGKNYDLAINKSLFVGNILVVVVIVLASALFITYRVIRSKIPDKDDNLEIEDNYHHQRPSQTPTNNFGHDNQAVVTPGSHAQTSSPFTRSAEGASPVTGPIYEGFRERSGDMGRGRASSQPLIKVDA